MKPRLVISFSGGRTSALMVVLLLIRYGRTHDVIILFANTGAEHEKTLNFIHLCDTVLGFCTVWLEAVVHPEDGVGTTHRVVTFETASRNCEPFEAMIQKYGIPNKNYPHCTRELKHRPIYDYLDSIGWKKGTYKTAIGIRTDEVDRQSSKAAKDGLFYPLIKLAITKVFVIRWWRTQLFDLDLPEHYGNCVFCWKKSLRKLMTLATEDVRVFAFPARMEAQYAHAGAGEGPRVFFRGRRSAKDVMREAVMTDFEPYIPGVEYNHADLDEGQGCGETCELGADE